MRLLLMHAPEGLLHTAAHRFDAAVCGHTHGGHLALPFGIPVVVPGPLSRRYCHGRYRPRENPGTLFVSRGIGGIELPVRSFASPDVLVITLHGGPPTAASTRSR